MYKFKIAARDKSKLAHKLQSFLYQVTSCDPLVQFLFEKVKKTLTLSYTHADEMLQNTLSEWIWNAYTYVYEAHERVFWVSIRSTQCLNILYWKYMKLCVIFHECFFSHMANVKTQIINMNETFVTQVQIA